MSKLEAMALVWAPACFLGPNYGPFFHVQKVL